MSERKLIPEEIDELLTFIQRKGVIYYDVQIELIDHFACAIEKRWETEPQLSLEEALRAEFENFNRRDFNQIREAKEKALRKKYLRLQFHYIHEYFKLPKIVITIAITLTLFSAFALSGNFIKMYTLMVLVASISFYTYYSIFYKRNNRIELSEGKYLLLYNYYESVRARSIRIGSGLYILLILPNYIDKQQILTYQYLMSVQLLVAFLLTFIGIVVFAIVIYLPQRIKEDFTREFPQFVKS